MNGLEEKGVRFITGAKCEEIKKGSLAIITKEGKPESVMADTIVIAAGSRPNPDLFRSLRGMVPELYNIGDSVQPARILEAMDSGLRTGYTI